MTSARWLAVSVLFAAIACTADQARFGTGMLGGIELTVESVSTRGAYIDAEVHGDELPLRFFAAVSDDACARLLREGERLLYREIGLRGQLSRGELACHPHGIGPYRIDHGRMPRAASPSLGPRSQATYEKIHEDARGFMLRGRFPSATLIGWNGAYDTIVVLPRTQACEVVAASDVASMEYRSSSHRRLVLIGADSLCPVEGLIQP